MKTFRLIATGPIRLNREVEGDETLATITTEHNIATLFMMLQQKQARLEVDESDDDSVDDSVDESDKLPNPFAELLERAKASAKTTKLLADAGIDGVAKAKLYLSENGGSFESLEGMPKTTNEALVKLLSD